MHVADFTSGITYHNNICFTHAAFESYQWKVPVTIATSNNPAAVKIVLDKPSDTVTIEGVGADDWILVRIEDPCLRSRIAIN